MLILSEALEGEVHGSATVSRTVLNTHTTPSVSLLPSCLICLIVRHDLAAQRLGLLAASTRWRLFEVARQELVAGIATVLSSVAHVVSYGFAFMKSDLPFWCFAVFRFQVREFDTAEQMHDWMESCHRHHREQWSLERSQAGYKMKQNFRILRQRCGVPCSVCKLT